GGSRGSQGLRKVVQLELAFGQVDPAVRLARKLSRVLQVAVLRLTEVELLALAHRDVEQRLGIVAVDVQHLPQIAGGISVVAHPAVDQGTESFQAGIPGGAQAKRLASLQCRVTVAVPERFFQLLDFTHARISVNFGYPEILPAREPKTRGINTM